MSGPITSSRGFVTILVEGANRGEIRQVGSGRIFTFNLCNYKDRDLKLNMPISFQFDPYDPKYAFALVRLK